MVIMNTFLFCSRRGIRAQEEGNYSLAFNLLGEALLSKGLKITSAIKMEMRRLECLLSSGNYKACMEHLTRLEEKFSMQETFYYEAGLFYHRIEEYKKSVEYLLRALKLSPGDLVVFDTLARIYIDINQYGNAIKILHRCLEVPNPSRVGNISPAVIQVQLALCYFYTEEMSKARNHFRRAEKMDDTKIIDWDIYGRCLLYLERYEKALECFDRCLLEGVVEDEEIFLLKAKALSGLGKLEEAKKFINNAKKRLGEILIFPSDLKFFAPLLANGFMADIGAIFVED